MPMYHALGELPPKRHIQFRAPDGQLYTEEVFGLEGFDGNESILYHRHSPCRISRAFPHERVVLEEWLPEEHAHRHFKLKDFPVGGDPVRSRQPLMFNNDVIIWYVRPTDAMQSYYRNGQGDEIIFVHEGEGTLRTMFGPLRYRAGDYVVIPRGTIYQVVADEGSAQRHWIYETPGHFTIPKEYRNNHGMLHESAPYYHRDMRRPTELESYPDERGSFMLDIRVRDGFQRYELDYHPFNVVGWDGYCYPWILNIEDYEPKAGRIHQPPPAHLTFRGPGFVICSFVPRKMDWDERAIPIPYHHSNLDSEEVIYYVNGDFMSRKGIEYASVTLHPSGLPHGPQPGAVEASLGMEWTDEWATMIDTFRPLKLTRQCQQWDDPAYRYSWNQDLELDSNGRLPVGAGITG